MKMFANCYDCRNYRGYVNGREMGWKCTNEDASHHKKKSCKVSGCDGWTPVRRRDDLSPEEPAILDRPYKLWFVQIAGFEEENTNA